MADSSHLYSAVPRASPLFLREMEIRRGIELLLFGHSRLVGSMDSILQERGLGRAHQRALYFIARQPGLTVSDLLRILSITKQSLSRVVAELAAAGLIEQKVGEIDRRQRLLFLTAEGKAFEERLFEAARSVMAAAYQHAGQQSVSGFWSVLAGLLPLEDRALLFALEKPE